ncbi:MAG: DNA-binding protein [Aeropyrum sp.]|nr:DNA-binding protein [Aeropyrum sp.]MCE4616749.1 DNA-binding protein [Aeropyrum sp.]
MTIRSLGSQGRVFSVKVEEGEKVHEALARLAEDQDISLAIVSGIGGFSRAVIAYYKPEEATYYTVEVRPPTGFVIEVASLSGNIVRTSKGPSVHLHAVLGVNPEKTLSGHLVEGVVKPFLELFVQEVLVGRGEEVNVYSHRESFEASYRPYG